MLIGALEDVPGKMSATSYVPAAVPSLTHSSMPVPVLRLLK
jgi:hypothetical protein